MNELVRDRLRVVVLPDRAEHRPGRRRPCRRAAAPAPRSAGPGPGDLRRGGVAERVPRGARPRRGHRLGPRRRHSTSTSTSACQLGDPRAFGTWLDDRIFSLVRPGRVELIDGGATDPAAESRRYGDLIADGGLDLALLGIGENGHLAFNDPHVADFDDPEVVKLVEIDDTSRHQQVRDGAFDEFDAVPEAGVHGHDVDDSRQPGRSPSSCRAGRRPTRSRERSTARSTPLVRPRRSGAIPMPRCSPTKPPCPWPSADETGSRRADPHKEDRSWRRWPSTGGRRSGRGRSLAGRSSARKRSSCCWRRSGRATGARSTAPSWTGSRSSSRRSRMLVMRSAP